MSKECKCIVFLGPPGCGKGTQSQILKIKHGLVHLSTGDMLRDESASDSVLGKKIREVMNQGELVSDSIVIEMLRIHIKKCSASGSCVILDGFPRNIRQAVMLDELLKDISCNLQDVIYFDISDEALVERVEGRRVHLPSGRIYHDRLNPPKTPGKDDITGEDLIHREDDNASVLKKRLDVYHREMEKVLSYYEGKYILSQIDASRQPETVTNELEYKLLNGYSGNKNRM